MFLSPVFFLTELVEDVGVVPFVPVQPRTRRPPELVPGLVRHVGSEAVVAELRGQPVRGHRFESRASVGHWDILKEEK